MRGIKITPLSTNLCQHFLKNLYFYGSFFKIFLFINLVAPGLIYLFIFIFIFGCVRSSFLCEGFLQLRQAGATHHRGARASPVAEHRLQTRRLSSCGSRA